MFATKSHLRYNKHYHVGIMSMTGLSILESLVTNQTVNAKCSQIIEQIKELNNKIDVVDLESEQQSDFDHLELIKERQIHLESLFVEEHREWLLENESTLALLKQEIDQITVKYQSFLEAIKTDLLKTKKLKKGVNIYKNIIE